MRAQERPEVIRPLAKFGRGVVRVRQQGKGRRVL